MKSRFFVVLAAGLLVFSMGAAPAFAQWTRVVALPATPVFSVWASADTLIATVDTCVFVSRDAGATWNATTRLAPTVHSVQAARFTHGRLFAATFGQGMFVSDDQGATWQGFNQGLDAFQLQIDALVIRGDSLYAATEGGGVVVRDLVHAGTWHTYGDALEPNQAADVTALALGGDRLLAMAGDNGQVFVHDSPDADWTVSDLDNVGLHPGLQPGPGLWTGTSWLVGTIRGIFRSATGVEPWTRFDPGLGPIVWIPCASDGSQLFASFTTATPLTATIGHSTDDGVSWTLDESLPGVFVQQLAFSRSVLFAARGDGLWRRTGTTSAPPEVARGRGLSLALAGAQPIGATALLRLELSAPAPATLSVLDAAGRRVLGPFHLDANGGRQEIRLDTGALPSGVYEARITAAGHSAAVRLVRVR